MSPADSDAAADEDLLSDADLPIIVVWEGMLAVPIIGILDSDRTLRLTERLLNWIAEKRNQVVLLDVTAVSTIDTPTAQHLIDLVSALRLLGTRVIITGIRPEVAQTLVHLGITLDDIRTEATLSAGMEIGLEYLGYRVIRDGVRTAGTGAGYSARGSAAGAPTHVTE